MFRTVRGCAIQDLRLALPTPAQEVPPPPLPCHPPTRVRTISPRRYLARRWGVESAFGAFLDPVADKLMVATALVLLAGRFGQWVAIPAAVILVREIAVSALREWMAQQGLRNVVKVGFAGKCKTTLQMISIAVLLLAPTASLIQAPGVALSAGALVRSGTVLLNVAMLLTVTSGLAYFSAAWPYLMEEL